MRALLLCLLFVSAQAKSQSDFECGRYAVWKEARGESLKVQRAVLDVLAARVRKTGKPMCKVLSIRGQFPWRRYGIKHIDEGYNSVYNVVTKMPHVFKEDSGHLYFNHVRHPWGRRTVKLGGLYFSQ